MDYIIVGAGPTGLTLGYYLSKAGKKCIIIDKNDSIGGCHRVTRVSSGSSEGLFTEHGPRVYSSRYLNVKKVLKDLGTSFDETFTKYNVSLSTIGGKTISSLTLKEKGYFAYAFARLVMGDETLETTSILRWMKDKNFTEDSIDYVDRLCRLTDGAGADRYTLYQFLQLLNQNFFYELYQPRVPNDQGMMRKWYEKLQEVGCEVLLNQEIKSITDNSVILESGEELIGNNIILCIPPKYFSEITGLKKDWADRNSYIDDISISFHWNKKLDLPKRWGFPSSEWGVAFVILSNYFEPERRDAGGRLGLISTCITRPNVRSSFTEKTANESTEDEMIEEVFRQLSESIPEVPPYDNATLTPGTRKFTSGTGGPGRWISGDSGYVRTYHNEYVPYLVEGFQNMYYVGTQNGKSSYDFTSMESAVTNALYFLRDVCEVNVPPIEQGWTLVDLIRSIIFCLLAYCVYSLR